MAFLDDLEQIARWGARATELRDTMLKKSIAASAQDSIFQFPVLVSNTVRLDMANGVTKMLDRRYASFVQLAMSQVANVDISKYRTPAQFMRRLHKNMKVESVEINESVDSEDERLIQNAFMEGDAVLAINKKRGIALAFESYNGNRIKKISNLNIDYAREYLSDFNLLPIDGNITMEAPGDPNDEPESDNVLQDSDLVSGAINNAIRRSSMDQQELNTKIYGKGNAPKLMNDVEIKKMNDATPYAIQCHLNVINDKDEFVEYWDFVVGVKAYLHLIKSNEMIENIGRVMQNRNAFNNLVRWTTGEISFVKDILLHVNDIKLDMRNMQNGYSAWFPTLKRLKDKKIGIRDFRVQQLLPTTTLVISSYELDEIERQYGILLKDLSVARRLMDRLFLMGFVIVDDGSETVDILNNGESSTFETYALETIEREINLSKNTLGKEIGRMISSTR